MRTPAILAILGILSILATGAMAQVPAADDLVSTDSVPRTLSKVIDAPGARDGSSSAAGPMAEAAPKRASPVTEVVLAPVVAGGHGLLALGLEIISGFFRGVSEGTATIGQAMDTIASAPRASAGIAAISVAVLSAFSFFAVLAQRYGGLGAIPLFSRIAKADILNNKLRADIFELIQASPGIHVTDISQRLGIAWGTCTHHLQKLRAEKLVAIRSSGHQKCYFPNGGSYTPHEMEVLGVTKNATAKRIAEFVIQEGSLSHGDVARGLGLSPALVSFHATKLVQAGILERGREGRRTMFRALDANLAPAARPMVHSV